MPLFPTAEMEAAPQDGAIVHHAQGWHFTVTVEAELQAIAGRIASQHPYTTCVDLFVESLSREIHGAHQIHFPVDAGGGRVVLLVRCANIVEQS